MRIFPAAPENAYELRESGPTTLRGLAYMALLAELVNAIAEFGRAEQRHRLLPARFVVY